MKRTLSLRSFAVVLVIVACVVLFVTALPSAPASSAPSAEGQVQRAWQRAQEAGAYRFATQLVQTTHPAPKLVNVGRSPRQDTLYIEGQTDLPNRGLWMTLWQDGGSALNPRDGVELRIEGERAYGRTIGGTWQEVQDFSAAFAPDSDPLAYLAGAKNVRELGQETRALPSGDGSPTGGGPLTYGEGLTYTRYAFAVDGPAFATHLRDQLEGYLIERGQLPAGLRLDSTNQYRGMVGDGEVWIDSAGLPLRLSVHLEYPQARGGERVEAEIQTDFSDFAPLAEARRPLERLSAALGLPRTPRDRLRAATVGVFLLLPALLMTPRRSKKMYAALALAIIFSMLIGPLLDAQQVFAFSHWVDAQREAQAASQAEEQASRQWAAEWIAPPWDPHADPLAAPQDRTALAAPDEASVPLLPLAVPGAGESLRLALAPGGNDAAADSDGDGLSDVHEIRLGTLTDDSDSDGDSISDYMEVHGFAMAAGQAPWYHVGDQRWFSDPLNADTNNDGLLDSQECPERVSLDLDGDGQLEMDELPDLETPCHDTDGDDIPDMFDADNDGDQVPDRVDLSSDTVLGDGSAPFTSANPFQLTVNAHQPNYPLLVDLQLRPVNPAHLTYALNVLDWPVDTDGQVQHGKNTTFADSDNPELRSDDAAAANGDMRLIPMLEIEMTGDEIPLPLTTHLATRVELRGEISGTVDLAQQGVAVGLDFSFADGRSYTVNVHQGTCHRLGQALASLTGVADGATHILPSRDLVDLADGEHALTAAAGESAVCADLDNLVNGPYDDRMVDLSALQPYGISVREKDRAGTLLAYAPLNMVTDETGGGRVAFAARMFYRPGSEDWGDAQQVRVVWLLQMLSDACQPGAGNCQTQRTLDQMGVQHTYPEAWRLTGLSVREDHGMDVAILFEEPAGDVDPQTEDWLWQASQGLAAAYIGARDCDQVVNEACVGNGVRDIAVAAGYGDSTIRQRLHLTSTATLTERWGIPYSATLHVETRSFEHQDYIAHIMMTDTVKVLNDYFTDPATGEPKVQAPTLLFAIDKRARGANLDGEGWNGARLTIDANEDSTAALKWAPYRYTSQAGWEAYPIDEYWDLMDVSYKALLRRLFPADDEDVTQGKMLAARSYYLSLFVGMAGLVQSGQDVLYTPTSGDDTDAILSLVASAGGQAQIFRFVVEKIGSTMQGLSRRTTTLKLTQAQFWRELGQAFQDDSAWADLSRSGNWGKAGVGLAIGGALTAVSLTIASSVMDPTSANIAANVTNGLSLLMEIQGAVEAGAKVLDAVRDAGGFARAAAKGLSKVAKSIGDEFKSKASIGLVIAIAVTWAVAMVEIFMGSGHAYAVGSAVSEAVAGTIVAVLMFAIAAIPVVGWIVAAVIGVLDALAAAICGALSQEQQGGLAGRWLCGGITGMVTNIFKMMFYSGDVLVDMDDPDRFQIGGLDYALATPELGMSVGSRLDYTATVTNTIKYYPPLQGTPGEDADDLLQSSTFAYKWQTQETDFHAGQVRGTMRPAWRPVGARFRITETVAMTSALTLDSPGVNRPAGLYLSEAYAVPVQNCVLFGICWITDEKDTNHTYMGRTIKYDVFPATLDGFYTPVQLDLAVDGYSLAWGQTGDVTFPLQKDFDGDGLACKAGNGADPNDRLWDTDGDGLSDRFEDGIGTDNTNFDSDADGLNDRQELVLETDPLRADSDSDGLQDGEELTGWEFVYAQDSAGVPLRTWVTSDPLDPDGDGDNLTDFQEKTFGFHPGVWSDPQVLTFASQVREAGAPGLLLRLEEGTGAHLFGDRSGLANNGLCEGEGCPAAGVWGRYGNALLFDGLDDVVRVEHSALGASASGLTVAAWVKPSQLSGRGWIVASAQTASVDGFGFGVDGADLIFSAFGVHDYVLPGAGIAVDDWVHLAAVLNGNHTVSFYVDGQFRLASGYAQPPQPDPDDALLIGATTAPGGAAPSELFAGRIDELVLFDRALSPAEIERVMAARYNPDDLIVAPGDVLDYRAQVKNELLNRYAQGLLSLDVPQTLSGDGVTPTVFVLQPQQQAVMSGTLQVAVPATSGVVNLTQVARAQISDWREGSDFAELWLRLDEGAGATTFRDSSGNQPARDGTCVGGGCPTALASALQFDGIADVVSLPDAGTLGLTASSFTLSAWVNLGDLSGERAVLGGAGLFLGLRAGAPYMRFGGYELDSGVALSAGKWVHLAYRFDQGAAEQAIFVDGERVRDQLGTAAFQGGGALTLGGSAGGGFFQGLIDDVRLFGRALPADEIRALYGRPALHMPFEEAGAPFVDTEFGTRATCSGAACPVTGITGREGYGLSYNGGQSLSIAEGGSLDLSDGHFTVGAWIFPSESNAYPQGILGSKSGSGNSYPTLYRVGRRLGFGFSSGTVLTTTETAQDVLTLDDWNHVALTCSEDQLVLYVNGIVVGSRLGPDANWCARQSSAFYLGRATDTARVYLQSLHVHDEGDGAGYAELMISWGNELPWNRGGCDAGDWYDIEQTLWFQDQKSLRVWERDGGAWATYDDGDDNLVYRSFSTNHPGDSAITGWYGSGGATEVTLHHQYTNPSVPFQGRIDELVIYKRALSAADVDELYQSAFAAMRLRFDDPPGSTRFDNAVDPSGANDGLCAGAACPMAGASGRDNQAVRFDGVDDAVSTAMRIDPSDAGEGVTLLAWVYPESTSAGNHQVISSDDGGYDWSLLRQGAAWCVFTGAAPHCFPGATAAVGQWQHVAAVFDPGSDRVTFYRNGVAAGDAPLPGGLGASRRAIAIGHNPSSGDERFDGRIDDVQVVARALEGWEIARHYGAAPQLQLHLDEPVGATQFIDSSGNGNHGLSASDTTSPTAGLAGQIGLALAFDGVDDVLTVPDAPALDLTSFTVGAWVNPYGDGTITQTLLAKGSNYHLLIGPAQDRVGFGYVGGGDCIFSYDYVSAGSFIPGAWNHVLLTHDGVDLKLYLNGSLDRSVRTGGTPCLNNEPLQIGNGMPGTAPLRGRVDELTLYDHALSPFEVRDIFLYQGKGIEERQSHAITVDAEPPSSILRSDEPYRPDREVVLQVEARDSGSGVALEELGVQKPGQGGTTWTAAPRCLDAPGDTAWCPRFVPAGEGTYSLQLRGTDRVGNRETPAQTYVIYVDATPPDVGIDLPANSLVGAQFHPTLKYTWAAPLSGPVSDPGIPGGQTGSGVGAVWVTLLTAGGELAGAGAQRATVAAGSWSLAYALGAADPSGTYTVTVQAEDNVGNSTRVVAAVQVMRLEAKPARPPATAALEVASAPYLPVFAVRGSEGAATDRAETATPARVAPSAGVTESFYLDARAPAAHLDLGSLPTSSVSSTLPFRGIASDRVVPVGVSWTTDDGAAEAGLEIGCADMTWHAAEPGTLSDQRGYLWEGRLQRGADCWVRLRDSAGDGGLGGSVQVCGSPVANWTPADYTNALEIPFTVAAPECEPDLPVAGLEQVEVAFRPTTPGSPFYNEMPPAGQVLHLPLDDGPGGSGRLRFQDLSGLGHTGDCSGDECPNPGGTGHTGRAARFDGVDDRLQVNQDLNRLPLTVGMWFYMTREAAAYADWPEGVYLFSNDDPGHWGFGLSISQSENKLVVQKHNGWDDSNVVVPLNEWHHVAIVTDASGSYHLYWDGIERFSGTTALEQDGKAYFWIGGNPADPAARRYFTGLIDDVRVLDRALSADQVRDLYLGAGPVLALPLDTPFKAHGDRLVDASGWGHDGVLECGTDDPAIKTVPGQVGSYALAFDGADDVVTVPDRPALDLDRLSVGAWVRPQGFGVEQPLIVKSNQTGAPVNYGIYLTADGHARFVIYKADCTTPQSMDSASSLALNRWTHVMLTFDGERFTGYLDGQPAASSSFPAAGLCQDDGALVSGPFAGALDDVRVYPRALRQAEIVALVQSAWHTATLSSQGADTATWNAQVPAGLEGVYRLDVRAWDLAGHPDNSAQSQDAWRGSVDTAAPRVRLTRQMLDGTTDRYTAEAWDFNLAEEAFLSPCGDAAGAAREFYQSPWYLTAPGGTFTEAQRLHHLSESCTAPAAHDLTPVGVDEVPNPIRVVVSGSYAYVGNRTLGLRVLNVSDPANPFQVGIYSDTVMMSELAVTGDYVYLMASDYVDVVDVSDPTRPMQVNRFYPCAFCRSLAIAGGYAYVVESNLVSIWDVTDPTNPQHVQDYTSPSGIISDVDAVGEYVYLAAGASGLEIIDVHDPSNPFLAGQYPTTYTASDVKVHGNIAYVGVTVPDRWDDSRLLLLDVGNPANPQYRSDYQTPGYSGATVTEFFTRTYAYVAGGYWGLRVWDVSDPINPVPVGFADEPAWETMTWKAYTADVAVAGNYAYVAYSHADLRIYQLYGSGDGEPMTACDVYGNCVTTEAQAGALGPGVFIHAIPTPPDFFPNVVRIWPEVHAVVSPGQLQALAALPETEARQRITQLQAVDSMRALTVTVDATPVYTETWADGELMGVALRYVDWTPASDGSADGPHVIRATVANWATPPATYSDTLTVTVDTQPPTISVAPGPISGSAYRPDGGIELTGQVTDTAGVAAVQLSVDAAAGAVAALEAAVTAGTWRAAWPVDAWHLPDGETVTVTAQATDVGGHTASSTRSMSVDVAPPAPVTLTLRTAAGAIGPGATVRAVSLPLTLTWSASSDGSGLARYLTHWTVSAGDGVSDVLRTHAPASRADVLAVPEPARVTLRLAAEDVHGNARWQSFGPVYVDSPFTPDYVSLETGETGPSRPYADWMQTGCSLVGVDRRADLTAPGGAALASEQRLYATWDAGGVRLAWTGANWSNDGDLFIYLDTAAGGSVVAHNPYSPTMTDTLIYLPGVTPDSTAAGMAADYLVWVQDSETAELWRWDGAAWVLATDLGPNVYRFDPSLRQGQTDLYLPFSQLGIGDPAAATLDLLALASEDEGFASGAGQGLRLWAAMPPANPVNSARVVETSHYAEARLTFALLRRYHWEGLGPGVCPNGAIPAPAKAGDARPLATSQAGAFHDADLELSLSVEPAGLVYHYLGDGLFWMWESLFGGRSGDASTLFTFADAEHPPLGDGAQITFTLRYNNRGTAPASAVQLDLSARYALRLPEGTHLPGEQRDHQVINLDTIPPGAERSLTFTGVVDVQRAFNAYYVPCLATAPEPVCAAYLRVAALEAAVYDAAHPSPGPALEWMWADFGVDHQPPAFYDIQSPELLVSTGTNTVRGYAFDAAGVTTVTLAVNTPSAGTHTITCPDPTPADGRWSCPWDVTASNGGVAPQDGAVFGVRLGVVDGTGQAVEHSGWRSFIVDASPPTVTLDPQASDVVTSGVLLRESTFTLAGAVADNRALGRVEVCVDGDCRPADVALDPAAVAVTYEDVPAAPIAIGAGTACGGGELTRSWSVTESFAIDTVSVGFSAQHSHRDDLWVELASPSGTRVKLLFTDGITETRFSHFDALLHDAATDVHSARQDDDPSAPYHDRAARPHEPLRIFRGEDAAGTWTLSICDTHPAQDDGLYQRARLNLKPSDTSARAGRWSYTVHNLDEMDGVQKNIAIYGVDKVGNRSTAPLQLDVTIDNVPPQVTVLSRLDRLPLGSREVVLAGLATDGGGLGEVSVYVQTPGGAFDTTPTTPTEFYHVYLPPILRGAFSAVRAWEQLVNGSTPSSDRPLEVAGAPQVQAWEYTLEPNQVGVYRLWVTAVDVAGNSTTEGPFEVVVDRQEPRRVYLPAVLARFRQLPDLLLADGEITATGAELEIVNLGPGSVTGGFRVDVYFNPAPIPTGPGQVWQDLAPYGGHWLVDGAALPLDPGEQITLTLNDAYYQAAASRYPPRWQEVQAFYIQVDTLDEVLETHEALGGDYENISGEVISAIQNADDANDR